MAARRLFRLGTARFAAGRPGSAVAPDMRLAPMDLLVHRRGDDQAHCSLIVPDQRPVYDPPRHHVRNLEEQESLTGSGTQHGQIEMFQDPTDAFAQCTRVGTLDLCYRNEHFQSAAAVAAAQIPSHAFSAARPTSAATAAASAAAAAAGGATFGGGNVFAGTSCRLWKSEAPSLGSRHLSTSVVIGQWQKTRSSCQMRLPFSSKFGSHSQLQQIIIRWSSSQSTAAAAPAQDAKKEAVVISDKCVERLSAIALEEGRPVFLRLTVEGGGCSGFQYVFTLEDKTKDDDHVFGRDGVCVVVDDVSLMFVSGATVDFADELIRSAFQVIENPNSSSACGCGASFTAK